MKRVYFNLNGNKCNIHGELPSKVFVFIDAIRNILQNDGFSRLEWDFEDTFISIRKLRVNHKFEYLMYLTDKITKKI